MPSAFAYSTQNEYVFQSVVKNGRTVSPRTSLEKR